MESILAAGSCNAQSLDYIRKDDDACIPPLPLSHSWHIPKVVGVMTSAKLLFFLLLLPLLLHCVIVMLCIPQHLLLPYCCCFIVMVSTAVSKHYATRYFGFIVENFRVACAIMQGTIGAVVWSSSVTLGRSRWNKLPSRLRNRF